SFLHASLCVEPASWRSGRSSIFRWLRDLYIGLLLLLITLRNKGRTYSYRSKDHLPLFCWANRDGEHAVGGYGGGFRRVVRAGWRHDAADFRLSRRAISKPGLCAWPSLRAGGY